MYSADERETIITTSDVENTWDIYTRQKRIMKLLRDKGYTPYKVEMEGDIIVAESFQIDLSKITIRNAITKKREYTDKERAAKAEHMRRIRELR